MEARNHPVVSTPGVNSSTNAAGAELLGSFQHGNYRKPLLDSVFSPHRPDILFVCIKGCAMNGMDAAPVQLNSSMHVLQQLLRDVGMNIDTPQLYTDATVANSLAARQGLTESHTTSRSSLSMVTRPNGAEEDDSFESSRRPADMGTKHVAVSILKKHCGMVGLRGEHDTDERLHHGYPPCPECKLYLDSDCENSPVYHFDSTTGSKTTGIEFSCSWTPGLHRRSRSGALG
eukprot:2136559-Amphidinium_carterae.1